ncbi:MAG: glycosyltransferase family 1 protein, partial [Ignavibacteria bacterium]|nr:glycosyltransferase family 1 protein [Ignavibacteria bacterium]
LRKSHRIITVSEFSRSEIIKFFGIPSKKIRIIYNTASSIFKPRKYFIEESDNFRKKFNLPEKFILNVGVINKRKNIIALLKMYDILITKGSKLGLVLIGKPGFDYENIGPEIEKRGKGVVRINSMSDDELLQLYNMAFAFVFPSYYEGFGIPPLEAMQTGLPVIASNTSSLPEVVGEGGITRDPDDYVSFANDIIKFETDSEFYSLMRTKALQQSEKFNIRETTLQLIDIFNEFKLTK